MPSQTFTIKFKKNSGRIFSADEIRSLYFFGIPIKDPATGSLMSDEDVEFYIDSVQESIENTLSIKLSQQIYSENRDFDRDEWANWSYIPTTFPVVAPVSLQGFLNSTLQVDYPEQWLSAKKSSDSKFFYRKINLVPIHGSANSLSSNAVYIGISPHVGYFGTDNIPNYWELKYVTGWPKGVPKDILNVAGKLIAINIFHQLGDIIVGAGVASKSIGVDGFSQSIATTSSATNSGYGARIQGYLKDLDQAIPNLILRYKGITFGVM